ncbi:DUF4126 domain-containing protein [Brachybacterium sp. DNPG3]
MDGITSSLMAIGSGSASGLRPYLTVLILSIAGMTIPDDAPLLIGVAAAQIPPLLANPWVAGLCALLAIGDCGIDKVLGLNLPFEALNQIIRPIFGALVGMQLGSTAGPEFAVLNTMLGVGTATPVSLGKGSLTAGLTAAFPEPVSQVVRSVL